MAQRMIRGPRKHGFINIIYLNIDNLTNRKHVGVACFVLYHPKKIGNMDSNKLLPSDELTISDWKMDPE